MINKISNVNFGHQIEVSVWHNMKPSRKVFAIKKGQSDVLQEFFRDKSMLFEEEYLSKSNANFIQKMIENIIGYKLPFTRTPKTVYNYGDSVIIQDSQYKILNGAEIKIDFNK